MLHAPQDLVVETSPNLDRNWYRVQLALQSMLAVFVLAGLAGVCGNGWLSSDSVRIGSYEATYDRFARKTVPFRITLRSSERRHAGPLRVTLGRDLTEKAAIIRTVPAALSSSETASGTEFAFQTDGAPTQIVVSVQPAWPGVFHWRLAIDGAGEASLFQIIYP
jgi:hypothetical protein